MLDPMPEPSLESPDIEYYPQPNDKCECGHLHKEHYSRGAECWGEDCGCREFEPDPPITKHPFVYYTPAANR